jgi:hypothetical protein
LLIDFRKYRSIGLDQCGAALNAIGRGHPIGKFQKCLGENALAAIDIDDPLIVSEVRGRKGDALLRDALGQRLAFEFGEPFVVGAATAAQRGSRGLGGAQGRQANHHAYRLAPHSRYQSRISSPVQ